MPRSPALLATMFARVVDRLNAVSMDNGARENANHPTGGPVETSDSLEYITNIKASII